MLVDLAGRGIDCGDPDSRGLAGLQRVEFRVEGLQFRCHGHRSVRQGLIRGGRARAEKQGKSESESECARTVMSDAAPV
jgi:hypothetical protein